MSVIENAEIRTADVLLAKAMTGDASVIIEELYLATLSRYPSASEMLAASNIIGQTGVRRGAELLQWALLNKLEFLFSY